LRKFGLPDLVLEDYLPYLPAMGGPTSIVATLLLSGRRPDEQTGDLVIRTDDPIVARVTYGAVNPISSKTTLRLVPARPFHGQPQSRMLEISFDGQPHPTLCERQMQVHLNLIRGPYAALSSDERRSLYLAIARARSKLKNLREQSHILHAAGTRVFVARRTDFRVVIAHMRKTGVEWTQTWYAAMTERPDDDGSPFPLMELWQGDPRQGGDVHRLPDPSVRRRVTYEVHEDTPDENWIEDVLVIDKNGKAEGGEVTELLKTLLPALAKRSTP
jgi:hypothetical protein